MSNRLNSDYVDTRCDVCRRVPNKGLKCLCGRTAWKKPERRPDTAREASLRRALFAARAKWHKLRENHLRAGVMRAHADMVNADNQRNKDHHANEEALFRRHMEIEETIVADYRKRAGVKP